MENKRVVILGAGPAGLAAANELVNKGIRPLVLEKSGNVGGISRTETFRDYYYDIGGHRFFTKIERINNLWHEMLSDDFIRVRRLSRIYYNDRFFKYPIAFTNALFNLGLKESCLIPLSYLMARIRPHPNEDNFEEWITNRFGRRLYRTFFKTYTEKVWGIPCDRIKADWASQRIKGLSLMAAVSNALFGNNKAKTLIDEFEYPVKGPGMMWQRFKERIEAGGGEVHLNSEVKEVKYAKDHVTHVLSEQSGRRIRFAASDVISSIPITELIAVLDPSAPGDIYSASRGLTYRSFTLVGLICEKADMFPDQWIYIHSPKVRVGRIQNFKNWSPAMVPDPNMTCIGMEYFCSEGDGVWNMDESDLIALAIAELAQLGLARENDVSEGFVVRQPKAYPVYDDAYWVNLGKIRKFLATIPSLQTIGRNGMHRYNNMDHSMCTGILAAKNVLGANHNIWEVNEEAEYLEEDKTAKRKKAVQEERIKTAFAKIHQGALGVSVGTVSGLIIFFATVRLVFWPWDHPGANLGLLSQYFWGYSIGIRGAFVGLFYGFLTGFIFGWSFAYLRNFFLRKYVRGIKRKQEKQSFQQIY